MKTIEVLKRIQNDHENIVNDQPQRFPEAATDGDCYRQGDIYVIRRDAMHAECELIKKPAMQLAPGTTKGSRHIIDSAKGVKVYHQNGGDALQGPWLKFDCERTITHPEHGDIICPVGIYEITYQRAYAEELRRVLD